jgi:CelD/BcsL family acetyltransferase involved in cellulose biosynthesis
MHIDAIDNFEMLTQFRRDWDAVYEADPEAHFFLSWAWMSKWLKEIRTPWLVLAARPSAGTPASVAFFPLRWRARTTKGGEAYDELVMAGNRAADYTGLICAHEFQEQALQAFARYIQQLSWTALNLEFIRASDARIALFLQQFPENAFCATRVRQVSKTDNIDHCICPFIQLPQSWGDYLGSNVSANTRQKIRRFLRRVEDSEDLRITLAASDSIADHLEILLRFWASKWGHRKGESLTGLQNVLRMMLMHCFRRGTLLLPVLWKGGAPIGALAILIDRQKKSLLFYVGGRDGKIGSPPPGFVLHAYSIRYAIDNGFTTYDFLRGNEPYKYAFGAAERHISHIVVSAPKGRTLAQGLESRPIPRPHVSGIRQTSHVRSCEVS